MDSDTNIFYEIENNDLEAIQNLITEENKNDALISAAKYGSPEAINLLLDAGANIHYQNEDPLFHAIQYHKIENTETLLERGADVNARNSRFLAYLTRVEPEDNTEELISLLLQYGAVVTRNIALSALYSSLPRETVIQIVQDYPSLNHSNNNLLQEIIDAGDYYQVDLLLDSGLIVGLDEALANVAAILDNNYFNPVIGNENYIAIEALLRSKLGLEPRERIEIPPINEDTVSEADEDEETEQDRENRLARIRIAREMEEKNEERRRAFVEEYKNAEIKEDSSVGSSTKRSACSNESNLYGDPVNEDEILVFLIEGKETGECLSKEEISAIMESTQQMALWNGPPSGVILSQDVQPGRRMAGSPVYKLPWSGVWVEKEVLETALNSEEKSTIILEGEPASIGSSFGVSQLHGQWGGHWGYVLRNNDQVAVYVENGNFQPDERYLVYKVKEVL